MGKAQIDRTHSDLEFKVNNFAFIKMHLPTHISDCVRHRGSPDNFREEISEPLHIENVNKAYRVTSKVNYEIQMRRGNEGRLNLAYIDQTLQFRVLSRHYKPEKTRVLDLCHPDGSDPINLTSKAYMLIDHSPKAEHASYESPAQAP